MHFDTDSSSFYNRCSRFRSESITKDCKKRRHHFPDVHIPLHEYIYPRAHLIEFAVRKTFLRPLVFPPKKQISDHVSFPSFTGHFVSQFSQFSTYLSPFDLCGKKARSVVSRLSLSSYLQELEPRTDSRVGEEQPRTTCLEKEREREKHGRDWK